MRKKKAFLNVICSLSSYFTAMIFTFITQAMIVKILGIEYSGVNGLFTNILTMLSVAELGLSTTIIYKLYEPIAKNDKELIKTWLDFYKMCYRIVSIFVLIVGLIVIPLIPIIVGKTAINENLTYLYIVALLDTVFSYLMTYKRSLLHADQKNYIINIVHIGYLVLMNITQIVVLYIFKNYMYFLIIKLFYRLLENIVLNIYVNKKYPYVQEKANKISKFERRDFFKRIAAMFIQKISFVVNKGIDNICISVILGISSVGYYTNYNLIATTLCGIVFQIISALGASVGNLLTEKNYKKNYSIFKKINYFNSIITCLCIVGFINCIQSFIKVWIGEVYLLNIYVILSFGLYIYADSIRRSITIFKEAAGICKEDQLMYIYMAIINLTASILLCKTIGTSGVILGTAISYLFLIFYSYPKFIFKSVFKERVILYYKDTIKYIFMIILATLLANIICNSIDFEKMIISLIFRIFVSLFCTLFIFILFTYRSDEFKYYINIIKKVKRDEK